MIDCGKKLMDLRHPYQLKDVIDTVMNTVSGLIDVQWIEAAVMTDIAKLSKVTPQRWFHFDCPMEVRIKIFQTASKTYQIPYDTLRRKGWLHFAVTENQLCIQCRLYTPDQFGHYGYYTLEGDPL
jgi:hypothetical protein